MGCVPNIVDGFTNHREMWRWTRDKAATAEQDAVGFISSLRAKKMKHHTSACMFQCCGPAPALPHPGKGVAFRRVGQGLRVRCSIMQHHATLMDWRLCQEYKSGMLRSPLPFPFVDSQ